MNGMGAGIAPRPPPRARLMRPPRLRPPLYGCWNCCGAQACGAYAVGGAAGGAHAGGAYDVCGAAGLSLTLGLMRPTVLCWGVKDIIAIWCIICCCC